MLSVHVLIVCEGPQVNGLRDVQYGSGNVLSSLETVGSVAQSCRMMPQHQDLGYCRYQSIAPSFVVRSLPVSSCEHRYGC